MSAYLRVKICGVTNEADAVHAAELGADAVGLNFYKASPRYLTADRAKCILCALPAFVDPVGVFVSDEPPDDLKAIFKLVLGTIQVHGTEERIFMFPYAALRARWLPAFSVSEKNDLLRISDFLMKCHQRANDFPGRGAADPVAWMNKWQRGCAFPTAIMVDARVPGQFGGTGKTAPWELLADFRPEVPVVLAGGLTPENVGEAVRIVRPYAVDVASGVESSPGHKDPEKMRRFIENAREAAEK
jgi:phosphoribosylanthranilate isomerase